MIYLKSKEEINAIRSAGKIIQEIFEKIRPIIIPGTTTLEINSLVEEIVKTRNAVASFLNYGNPPFPGSICTSINEEVVHGIPSAKRRLKDGDIVSIDAGVYLGGFHADAARTYAVGNVAKDVQKLIDVTRECFFIGFSEFKPGNRISDVSAAIEKHAVKHGYGVVRELTGHGIGRNLHEEPDVPNFASREHGARIQEGLVVAIEPMINMGKAGVYVLDDAWTIVTADYMPSSHYENTVAISAEGPVILTEDI
jgi:methionyl aminopeptidase